MMDAPQKLRPTIPGEPGAPRADGTQSSTERPFGAIVSELWHNTETLVRQELQLGLARLDERTEELKVSLIAAALSGGLLLAGLLAILASATLLLSKVVDLWLAALIVGVAVSGVGYAILPRSSTKTSGERALLSNDPKTSPTIKETRP